MSSSKDDEPDDARGRRHRASGGDDADYRPSAASRAPAELLDLVREAEEAAKVGATDGSPTSNKMSAAAAAAAAANAKLDVVDVDDEAIDAPPSLPPQRAAGLMQPKTPASDGAIAAPPLGPVRPAYKEQQAEEQEEEQPPASKAVRRTGPRRRLEEDSMQREPPTPPSTSASPAVAPPAIRDGNMKTRALEQGSDRASSSSHRGLPPAVGIIILFMLAIGVLALITR